jgi:hypothetical protein
MSQSFNALAASQEWKDVPLFVSSTLRDTHAERDALRNRVFPAIDEMLRSHRYRFEPIDLRIGVESKPDDSGHGALAVFERDQAIAILKFAHSHDMEIVRTCSGHSKSGLSLSGRAGLVAFLHDVKNAAVDFDSRS